MENREEVEERRARAKGLARVAFVLALALAAPGAMAKDTLAEAPSPIGFAFFDPVQFPSSGAEVIGFRLSIFYGRNAAVTGLDIGALVSVSDGDVFGLQVSGLVNSSGLSSGSMQIAGVANNCYDEFNGLQISGIANCVGGDMAGGQIGCFNTSRDMSGIQIGAFNNAAAVAGCQIGVVNVASSMVGVQIGLLNIIKDSPYPCLPVFNAHF